MKTLEQKQNTFRNKCLRAAEQQDLNIPEFYTESPLSKDDAYEDDGVLHAVKHGIRAVFDVGEGQELNGASQNINTGAILSFLSMKRMITDRVLVKEIKEEDDYCPHCERSCGC